MRVTQITELSKNRSKIYLDDQFAFVLYKGELRQYHIRDGETLSEADYALIVGEVLPGRARMRAMNLLQSKDYTTAQLKAKLRQGLYPEAVIEDALAYVESFRYVDDLRYATDYIFCHQDTRSRMRIEQDLRAKGIADETMQKAWERWREQGGGQDEEAMIRALLEKRHFDPENADYAELRRQWSFLTRKGFSAESIRRVLREMDD